MAVTVQVAGVIFGRFGGSRFTACGFTSVSLRQAEILLPRPDVQFSHPAVTRTAQHGIRVTSSCRGSGRRREVAWSVDRLHSGVAWTPVLSRGGRRISEVEREESSGTRTSPGSLLSALISQLFQVYSDFRSDLCLLHVATTQVTAFTWTLESKIPVMIRVFLKKNYLIVLFVCLFVHVNIIS